MKKKWMGILLFVMGTMMILAGCEDKPYEGSGHSKDGTTYTIYIEADHIKSIGVSSENNTMVMENADGTLFKSGDKEVFSELDFEHKEKIQWVIEDEDGNVITTPDEYINDGKNHDMTLDEKKMMNPRK